VLKCTQLERIRQDGKEVKKMEESLQNMEIKFKGREQMCRNLQEKVQRTCVLPSLVCKTCDNDHAVC
jgi:hypothetical protein